MKISLPAILACGVLIFGAAGCTNGSPATDTSANNSSTSQTDSTSTQPAAAPGGMGNGLPAQTTLASAGSVDYTKVPTTTKVNGKTVKLIKLPSGLEYYDIKVGSGAQAKSGDTVDVLYTGTLIDGTKFDSTADRGNTPFEFPVGAGQVIAGWDQGIPSMRIGGTRRLVIPGALAYGPNSPTPTIPPNATLFFDVKLVAVK